MTRWVIAVVALLLVLGVSSAAADDSEKAVSPGARKVGEALREKFGTGEALEKRIKLKIETERSGAQGCVKVAQVVNDAELNYIEENMKELRTGGMKEAQEPLSTLIREAMLRKIRAASLKVQLRLIESKEFMLPACEAQVAATLRNIEFKLWDISSDLEQISSYLLDMAMNLDSMAGSAALK